MSIMTERDPRLGGRRKGQKDRRPRRPDLRLSGVLTAIRVANAAGFDLSVENSKVVLTPRAPQIRSDDSSE